MDMSDEDLNLFDDIQEENGDNFSDDLLPIKNKIESKNIWDIGTSNNSVDKNRQKIFHPDTNIDQNNMDIPENISNWRNTQQFNNNMNNNSNNSNRNFSPHFFQNSNIVNNNRNNFRGPFFRGRGRGKFRGRSSYY